MTPKYRLNNIDGLRAIAALSVLVQHIFGDILEMPNAVRTEIAQWAAGSVGVIDFGRFGVVLFFLISGFVVPFSLRRPAPLLRFAVSRVFRLYPAFWLAILVLAGIAAIRSDPVPSATLWTNMAMMPSFLGHSWMLGTYWTLSIEILFYVFVAVLFSAGLLYRPWIIFTVAGLLVAGTVVPVFCRSEGLAHLPVQYIGFHLSFLFSGLLLRLAVVERMPRVALGAGLLLAVQVVSAAAISGYSLGQGDRFALVGVLPISAAYVLAVMTFYVAIRTGRPNWAPLSAIGRASYSLYLFHWFACQLVYTVVPITGGARDLVTVGSCIAASLGLSFLIFSHVEMPAIAASKRLLRRLPSTDSDPHVAPDLKVLRFASLAPKPTLVTAFLGRSNWLRRSD